MHWIVDGYNVILSDSKLAKLFRANREIGRETFLQRIARSSKLKGEKIAVIFDGKFGASEERITSDIVIRFSASGETADDVIKREIARDTRRRSLKVVSDDNSISGYARECGAGVVGSKDFVALLGDHGRVKNLSSNSIQEKPVAGTGLDKELLKLFRGGDNRNT